MWEKFKQLSLPIRILIFILIGIILAFLASVIMGGIETYMANRGIDKALEERDQAIKQAQEFKVIAEKESAEKEQFKGAAAAYKEQIEAKDQQLEELYESQPALRQRAIDAGNKVKAIQESKIRPIDENIRQRVDDLGRELDRLYSN